MNMTNKKLLCENLYKRYLELKEKTRVDVNVNTSGKITDPKHLSAEDLLNKEAVRQQLLDCKDSLDLRPEEWFEIENG
jgi:hypothetical protein